MLRQIRNPKSKPKTHQSLARAVMARSQSIGPIISPKPPLHPQTRKPDPITTPTRTSLSRSSSPLSSGSISKSGLVADLASKRAALQSLGVRPDHDAVSRARSKLEEIDAVLSKKLEEIVLSKRPETVERLEWRAVLAERERACREEAEREKSVYREIVERDEAYERCEKMVRAAEERLVRVYEDAQVTGRCSAAGSGDIGIGGFGGLNCELNDEIGGLVEENRERLDLSRRKIRVLPENLFGRLCGLRVINISNNQLKAIPDSVVALSNLEELNVSSNLLESLPESIGSLPKLKVLNVSGNKLSALPDSICNCRSLVELDVSFNNFSYLPTNIGPELSDLQVLSIQLNKITSLPTSIGEMRSLKHLDAHFNELHGLPSSIGKLTNLETLNLSSNFSDLTELPRTIGDLKNLKELDLSNNQIRSLPSSFCQLENLIKLNLDGNPVEVPPMDVVRDGIEAVRMFLLRRQFNKDGSIDAVEERAQNGWWRHGSCWLNYFLSIILASLSRYLRTERRSAKDHYLDQQL